MTIHDDGRHLIQARVGEQEIETRIVCLNDEEGVPAWCNREGTCEVLDQWDSLRVDMLDVDRDKKPEWTTLGAVLWEYTHLGGIADFNEDEVWLKPSVKHREDFLGDRPNPV